MPEFTFVSKSSKYESTNAYWLAACAKLAYEEPAAVEAQAKAWGFSGFRFIHGKGIQSADQLAEKVAAGAAITLGAEGTEAFVIANDDVVIVAFRGTEEVHDFIADARAHQAVCPCGDAWGMSHNGFSSAFGAGVRDDLRAAVKALRTNKQGIWVTGHSLGAALATLGAAELTEAGQAVEGVYTFGQPRVGDAAFVAKYDASLGARHFRFVNNNDIVTRVPIRDFKYKSFKVQYRHVGQFVYIKTDGSLTTDITKWALSVDRALGRIEAAAQGDWKDGITDHSMKNYVAALESKIGVDPTA